MAFELPKLPYAYEALEPYVDARTVEIHHTRHHQAYVDNLNKALEGHADLQKMSIEELLGNINKVPSDIKQAVINHGGGHANHSFFWKIMASKGGGETKGELAEAINKTFGNFGKFKEEFSAKAMSVFGSGWAFLILNKEGKLQLKRQSFQNSPLMHGNIPILGLDVWEHAYYLKYQNRRAEYVEGWWNVVNWREVNALYVHSSK